MACYKITYLEGDSYMNKNSTYIYNAVDENDAIDIAVCDGQLEDNYTVLDIQLIFE